MQELKDNCHLFHCVKRSKYGAFFWSIFFRIQSKFGNIRARKNSVFGHFSCRVYLFKKNDPHETAQLCHVKIGYLRHSYKLRNHSSPLHVIQQKMQQSPYPPTFALVELILNNHGLMVSIYLFTVIMNSCLFGSTKTEHPATHVNIHNF